MADTIKIEAPPPTGGGAHVEFETKDGVPVLVIETWGHNSMPVRARRPLSHSEVNALREWTERAYPRGQER